MKKLVFLLSAIVFADIMYSQSLFDGMYGKDWVRERDEINQNCTQYINQTRNIISGGIRFEYESSSRSSSNSNYHAQQQAKNAQRDADHQEWLRRREAAMQLAAEQEKERERQREIERQRKYNETYGKYMEATEAQAAYLHAKVDYRATVGREYMYKFQVPGTEKIQSVYISSNSKSNLNAADIVENLRKTYNNQNIIRPLDGTYYQSSSNWDDYMSKNLFTSLKQFDSKVKLTPYISDDGIDNTWNGKSVYVSEENLEIIRESKNRFFDEVKSKIKDDFITDVLHFPGGILDKLETAVNICEAETSFIKSKFENLKKYAVSVAGANNLRQWKYFNNKLEDEKETGSFLHKLWESILE